MISGVCLEIGDGLTQVVPIRDSTVQPHSIITEHLGGRDITNLLLHLLNEDGQYENSLKTTAEAEIVREIKEKHSYIVLDYTEECKSYKRTPVVGSIMPDGQIRRLRDFPFKCGEILFQPQVFGSKASSLQHLIFNSISKCDAEIRPLLWQNIYLTGGLSEMEGLSQRLTYELLHIGAPASTAIHINSNSKISSWRGGAALVNSPKFTPMWILKEQYNEYGPSIVNIKCL